MLESVSHVGECQPCWRVSAMLESVSHVGECQPCWRESAMLESVSHVGECQPCWRVSAMLESVSHVGECQPCWKVSAMLESVSHVGECQPCWRVSAMLESVSHVGECQPCWRVSAMLESVSSQQVASSTLLNFTSFIWVCTDCGYSNYSHRAPNLNPILSCTNSYSILTNCSDDDLPNNCFFTSTPAKNKTPPIFSSKVKCQDNDNKL